MNINLSYSVRVVSVAVGPQPGAPPPVVPAQEGRVSFFLLVLAVLSCLELHALLVSLPRPPLWLLLISCCAVILGNWPAHLSLTGQPPQPWRDLASVFAAVVLAGFLYEMPAHGFSHDAKANEAECRCRSHDYYSRILPIDETQIPR